MAPLPNPAASNDDASTAQNNLLTELVRLPNDPAFQAVQMQQQLASIQNELRASHHNTSAMLANQHVTQPTQELRPLRNIMTNQPIPRFPRDLAAVQAIANVNTLRQLMAELGLDVLHDWTIERARQNFRQAIGCASS